MIFTSTNKLFHSIPPTQKKSRQTTSGYKERKPTSEKRALPLIVEV